MFELVEFRVLVWNTGGNIIQADGYGNINLDVSVISMKMDVGKMWIST